MKIKTSEDILDSLEKWHNENSQVKRKGINFEIPNPFPILNQQWVSLIDHKKEIKKIKNKIKKWHNSQDGYYDQCGKKTNHACDVCEFIDDLFKEK